MRVQFSRRFTKQYAQLTPRVRSRFKERLAVWMEHPSDPKLNNHPLKGRFAGYRSINVTGDYRAIYRPVSKDNNVFVAIGTHSQLYR